MYLRALARSLRVPDTTDVEKLTGELICGMNKVYPLEVEIISAYYCTV